MYALFPSPLGIFFISIEFTRDAMVLTYVFPSPTGFFFISIVKPENCYPCGTFPSPMGSFFISIKKKVYTYEKNHNSRVSVPYGDLFYFYLFGTDAFEPTDPAAFPSPTGSFFISIMLMFLQRWEQKCFRPLWGSFLFLPCPMETLAGIEKTCTLRCKKFSPVKSGDSKLVNCSDP